MKFPFTVTSPDGSTRLFSLKDEPITIGRSEDCSIVIKDDLTSRFHCRIFAKDHEIYVEDLGSKNGIMINNKKVNQSRFYLNDTLKVGHTTIAFQHSLMDQTTKDLLLPEQTFAKITRLRIENTIERENRKEEKISVQEINQRRLQKMKVRYESDSKEKYLKDDLETKYGSKIYGEIRFVNFLLNITLLYLPFFLSCIIDWNIFSIFHKGMLKFEFGVIFDKNVFPYSVSAFFIVFIFNLFNKNILIESCGEMIIKKMKRD